MTGVNRAIPTRYKDILFRSKLEADWAITLDGLGVRWQYEPEGRYWGPDRVFYCPDFWLPDTRQWLEVKGQESLLDMRKWCALLAHFDDEETIGLTLLVGQPAGALFGLNRLGVAKYHDSPTQLPPRWPIAAYHCYGCGSSDFWPWPFLTAVCRCGHTSIRLPLDPFPLTALPERELPARYPGEEQVAWEALMRRSTTKMEGETVSLVCAPCPAFYDCSGDSQTWAIGAAVDGRRASHKAKRVCFEVIEQLAT